MLQTLKINAGVQRFALSANGITQPGVDAIHALLREHGLPVPAESEVESVWVSKRGTYPKRLAKWARIAAGAAIPQGVLSKIGQIAAENTERQAEYLLDATTHFGWQAGDFGDSGSCYWGGRAGAREMITDAGGFAIRWWEEESPGEYRGLGRCWAIPVTVEDHPILVIFNQYHRYGRELLHTARVISALEGLSYRKIVLQNRGTASGTLWINGGVGYAIGADSVVSSLEEWDFGLEEPFYETCEHCGRGIVDEDDCYAVGGETWCARCCDMDAFCCERCEGAFPCDDAELVDGESWCRGCVESDATLCEHCGEYTRDEDAELVDGESWCRGCVESDATLCEYCNEYTRNEHIVQVDGEDWCEHCRDRHATLCEHCGKYARDEHIVQVDGESWCRGCVESDATLCEHCGKYTRDGGAELVDGESWCRGCREDATLTTCEHCGGQTQHLRQVNRETWCRKCCEGASLSWCDSCMGWVSAQDPESPCRLCGQLPLLVA